MTPASSRHRTLVDPPARQLPKSVRSGEPKRVLYIQHAGELSGSAMSLLYTIRSLDRAQWHPIVALIRPNARVAELYRAAGIECVEWPGIGTFEHTTAGHLRVTVPADWIQAARLPAVVRESVRRTHALLDQVVPDLVHLNSVVLAPAALALRRRDIPWVWHVREAPVQGLFGLRRRALSAALARWPVESFYISEADHQAWVRGEHGVVVHNFVELDRFRPDGENARQELAIPEDAPVLVFLGGISGVKGVMALLDALAILRDDFPGLRCLMPGALYEQSTSLPARAARRLLPLVGGGTWSQQVARRLRRNGLEETCVLLPFRPVIEPVLRAADVVVFPALRPHFPRPAIEAAALGKPVVASRLPGIDEVVIDGETGLLTKAGDVRALAAAIRKLLLDQELAVRLGAAGRLLAARRFDSVRQVKLITDVYERVLAAGSHGRAEVRDVNTLLPRGLTR